MIVRAPGGKRYDTVKRIFVDEPLDNSSSQNSGRSSSSTYSAPPRMESISRHRSSNGNIRSRINAFVAGIGNWFDYNAQTYSTNISTVFYFLAWIGLGLGVIGQLFTSGFLAALVTGIIGSIIVYYAAGIGMVILMYFISFLFKVFRYIFYNIYTLLLFIALITFSSISHLYQTYIQKDRIPATAVSTPVSSRPNYYCDVNTTLNVRSAPNKNADVLGQLTRGQEIYVYSIDNVTNFAKINYYGSIAYVSAEYLKPKNASATNYTYLAPNAGMTGWTTFLLKERVEKVIYDDGRYIYFNRDGNVLKHNLRESARGQKEFEYVYSSPYRFTLAGSNTPYKIVFDNYTRQEIWDNSEALGLTFTYDTQSRLISVREPEYGFARSETYTYNANFTYPSKEEVEYDYDDGGGIKESFTFSNYIFDNFGNWTSRSVNYKKVDEGEDKVKTTTKKYSEKRNIYYFNR